MKLSVCPWRRNSLVLAGTRGKATAAAGGVFSLALQSWGCVSGVSCGLVKLMGKPEVHGQVQGSLG